jgi:hypothetical protein
MLQPGFPTRLDAATTGRPPHRLLAQISPSLVAALAVVFAAGVAAGGAIYLHRSPIRETQTSGTAAWWPHLGLFVLATLLLAVARIRLRRRQLQSAGEAQAGLRPGHLLLLAPIGRLAARRVDRTLRAARHSANGLIRLVAVAIVAVPFGYGAFRAGIQVLAGLDPNFTTNAWGGPTYLGAMACHYLDGGLIMMASAWLMSRLLLPAHPVVGADAASRQHGSTGAG